MLLKNRPLLTDKEVAYYCDVSEYKLREQRNNSCPKDVPPHIKVGSRVWYRHHEVLEWAQKTGRPFESLILGEDDDG